MYAIRFNYLVSNFLLGEFCFSGRFDSPYLVDAKRSADMNVQKAFCDVPMDYLQKEGKFFVRFLPKTDANVEFLIVPWQRSVVSMFLFSPSNRNLFF